MNLQAENPDKLHPNPSIEGKSRLLWLILGDVEDYGFRRAFLSLIEALEKRSVEVGFVSIYSGPFSDEIAEAGYPIWFLGKNRGSEDTKNAGWRFLLGGMRLFFSAFSNRRSISKIVKTFNPDWIHISNNSLLITGGLASRTTGVPAYWHIHNTILSKLPFKLQPLSYQAISRVLGVKPIANSRHTADSLGDSICPAGISYPGTNTDYFSIRAKFPTISREDLGVDPQLPLFAIAARLDPKKAQDRVVEAAIRLYSKGKRFSLLLVGGPLNSDFALGIRKRIDEANAGDLIRMVGQVSDVRPYYLASDVVINSRVDAEPFGLSVVEAMLMGRPVLAYKLGGPSETVVDGLTGWHIDEPSVESYEAGLDRSLDYRKYWSKMGCSARRIAAARFSIEETTNMYLRIVGKCVDEPEVSEAAITEDELKVIP